VQRDLRPCPLIRTPGAGKSLSGSGLIAREGQIARHGQVGDGRLSDPQQRPPRQILRLASAALRHRLSEYHIGPPGVSVENSQSVHTRTALV
jgi:hypothetical protein